MNRLVATVIIAAALLPASAEAAKLRFGGGSRSSHANADAHGTNGSSVMVTPRLGRSSKPVEAKADAPARPPFPTASTEPTLLKVSINEAPRPWCPSQVVVGGFCVLN